LFDGKIPKERVYLFLDEIQNLKNLPSVAKYLIDHYQVKFFLTGSVSFYLKNLFSESLSGRKVLFELFPLNFQEFLRFRCANKLDVQQLASEVGISRQTIYKYLYFFEKTYLISLLTPYSKSPDREVSGAKKVYFIDNGLAGVLTRLSSGQLLENAVFNKG